MGVMRSEATTEWTEGSEVGLLCSKAFGGLRVVFSIFIPSLFSFVWLICS